MTDNPCCEGNTCDEWHFCTTNSTCASCGQLDEVSCPDEECKGWFELLDGQCVNPFEANPSTNMYICESAEEGGGGDRSRRDWCYWYAAYQKGDTAICEHIEWDAMRDECAAGGNPDHYYVTIYFGTP